MGEGAPGNLASHLRGGGSSGRGGRAAPRAPGDGGAPGPGSAERRVPLRQEREVGRIPPAAAARTPTGRTAWGRQRTRPVDSSSSDSSPGTWTSRTLMLISTTSRPVMRSTALVTPARMRSAQSAISVP